MNNTCSPMLKSRKEVWKRINNHPDYEVSNTGCVRSWKRANGRGINPTNKPKLLKQRLAVLTKDYYEVNLSTRKKKHTIRVHKLVILAFGPPKPTEKHEVAHKDGKPGHNHISNLRWSTRSENERDKVKHGTSIRGSRNINAKLKEHQVLEIRELVESKVSCTDISKKFNITREAVYLIKNRINWAWLKPKEPKK